MAEPVKLVPWQENCRQDCIAVLQDALDRARSGEITECVVIMMRRDHEPVYRRSACESLTRTVGHLEGAKLSIWHEAMFGEPAAPVDDAS